jgi:hypothetical protein
VFLTKNLGKFAHMSLLALDFWVKNWGLKSQHTATTQAFGMQGKAGHGQTWRMGDRKKEVVSTNVS